MRTQRFVWKLILALTFIVLTGGTLACAEQVTGPRAWIDVPLDGSSVPVGTPIPVISHAYAREGVAEVLLSVNGEAYRRSPPTQPGITFTKVSQAWIPQQEGDYVLQVQAYSTNGEASNPATARVRVLGKGTPTPVLPVLSITPPIAGWTVTPVPVISITPPIAGGSVTPVPTTPFTPTPTIVTPLPPVACVGTPNIPSFSASPSTITAGGSATLSWGAVTNADSVSIEPGIGGVSTPGSRSVSPGTTTTYTLTARCGSNTLTRQTTVTVLPVVPVVTPTRTRTLTPLPDTTPPPIPNPQDPTGGESVSCSGASGNATLKWSSVSDPSGVHYYVKWNRAGQPASGWDGTGTQHGISIQCGYQYSWQVRACDNAGNCSAWSASATFMAGTVH